MNDHGSRRNGLLGRFVGHLLSYYDNPEGTDVRKQRRITSQSEDDILSPPKRRQMLANASGLVKNYAPAAWALGTHVHAVCNLRFHSRTGDEQLDRRITELFSWWSRKDNCDVAGRHSLSAMIRMWEWQACLTGDIFTLKLDDGRIQTIDGDRIASIGPANNGMDVSKFVHGVQVDDAGRALNYCVCKRTQNGLRHERIIPAWQVAQHGYFQSFSQIRGITPLSSCLSQFQDAAEASIYALLKMKLSQMIALAVFREKAKDGLGENTGGDESEGFEPQDYSNNIDLSNGKPKVLDLDDGDRAEWLESKSPSEQFQTYFDSSLCSAFKSLFIPSCLYFSGSSFAESRLKLFLWYEFVNTRRDVLRSLLLNLTAWRLGLFIADKELILPRGMTLGGLVDRLEFTGAPMPSINKLDDVRAACESMAAGLTSPQRAIRELSGDDPNIINDETAAWYKQRSELGLPDPALKPTGQTPTEQK